MFSFSFVYHLCANHLRWMKANKNACGQSVLGEIILYFFSISVKSDKHPTLFPYSYKHIHHILQATLSKTGKWPCVTKTINKKEMGSGKAETLLECTELYIWLDGGGVQLSRWHSTDLGCWLWLRFILNLAKDIMNKISNRWVCLSMLSGILGLRNQGGSQLNPPAEGRQHHPVCSVPWAPLFHIECQIAHPEPPSYG